MNNDLEPREEFVGFYQTPDTTDATIAICVKDALLRLDLSLTWLRGQTYVGASYTSGEYRGSQAIIAESQPLALYVQGLTVLI